MLQRVLGLKKTVLEVIICPSIHPLYTGLKFDNIKKTIKKNHQNLSNCKVLSWLIIPTFIIVEKKDEFMVQLRRVALIQHNIHYIANRYKRLSRSWCSTPGENQ